MQAKNRAIHYLYYIERYNNHTSEFSLCLFITFNQNLYFFFIAPTPVFYMCVICVEKTHNSYIINRLLQQSSRTNVSFNSRHFLFSNHQLYAMFIQTPLKRLSGKKQLKPHYLITQRITDGF